MAYKKYTLTLKIMDGRAAFNNAAAKPSMNQFLESQELSFSYHFFLLSFGPMNILYIRLFVSGQDG
jgi:hypothetical protein